MSDGRDIGVKFGQRGVLECEADAVPEPDFEWYKDDRRYQFLYLFSFQKGQTRFYVFPSLNINIDPFICFVIRFINGLDGMEIVNTGSLSKLTFFNVSDSDYGNYTCVAINKLGSSNTSFLIYGKYMNLA